MLLLLTISLFANVEFLLPEFFCEGTMQPLSVFLKSGRCSKKEESIVLLLAFKAFKENVLTINAYKDDNDVIFVPIPSACRF